MGREASTLGGQLAPRTSHAPINSEGPSAARQNGAVPLSLVPNAEDGWTAVRKWQRFLSVLSRMLIGGIHVAACRYPTDPPAISVRTRAQAQQHPDRICKDWKLRGSGH